jgi:hypothetical protein
MPASGVEMPMYCCEVRWRELRKQSSDETWEILFTAMLGGQVFLGIKRDSGSRYYRLATTVAFKQLEFL